jgi:hypothetical protein
MTFLRVFKRWGFRAAGFVWLVTLLQAQTATVSGLVTHRNKTPAVNYLVSIGGEARYTDIRGRYRMDGVRPGHYRLRIMKDGRVVRDVEVDVRGPAQTLNLDVP